MLEGLGKENSDELKEEELDSAGIRIIRGGDKKRKDALHPLPEENDEAAKLLKENSEGKN